MVSDPEGLTPRLMPGAGGGLRGGLDDGHRAGADPAAAAAGRAADQRLARMPQALEGYRGAAGRLAAAFHVALVGVALAGIAPHAVADPAGLGAEHQLLVGLDQARVLGPADLVGERYAAAPVLGQRVAIDVGQDQPRPEAGRGDIVAKRGHGLDDRAVERPGNQQEMGGVRRIAAGPQTGDVMRQELLELVLLLFVPGDADAKRRPEAHGILFLAFEAAQARDPGAP